MYCFNCGLSPKLGSKAVPFHGFSRHFHRKRFCMPSSIDWKCNPARDDACIHRDRRRHRDRRGIFPVLLRWIAEIPVLFRCAAEFLRSPSRDCPCASDRVRRNRMDIRCHPLPLPNLHDIVRPFHSIPAFFPRQDAQNCQIDAHCDIDHAENHRNNIGR